MDFLSIRFHTKIEIFMYFDFKDIDIKIPKCPICDAEYTVFSDEDGCCYIPSCNCQTEIYE